MKRYQPMSFRPSFGVAALALSALTMALAVGVPARLSNADSTMAAARDATWVTIDPAHVDAVGVRETDVALSPARPAGRRG